MDARVVDIVGQGRVGQAVGARLAAIGRRGAVLTRQDGALAEQGDAPVLVCSRNDDLDAVLERVPATRRDDLVFVQNGMLRPWLRARDLGEVTRGLLFFAVPTRGDDAQPGPDPSPFSGPRAAEVVDALEHAGIPARVVPESAFRALELEKLVWNCAFGLLCEALDVTVGEACDAHMDTTVAVCTELVVAGASALAIAVDVDAMTERLLAYSRSIAAYRGAVKEWPWRNGWFAGLGVDLPLHTELLRQAGRDPATGALTSR